MKLRKILSVIMCVIMCVGMCAFAFSAGAADAKPVLKFHEDGSFKVLMINDTQDNKNLNKLTEKFIRKAVAQENPDLIVVAGDILSDMWPGATEAQLEQNFKNICGVFTDLGVPFALTMGNHDHDRCDECSSVAHMMELATSYPLHVDTSDGCDPATYSIPVYSADGSKVQYVIYVMDSNNKGQALSMSGYTGLYPEQIEWLNAKSAEYKAANGGTPVKATVFQHVPVAEIYDFLKEIPMAEYTDDDSVFSSNDYKWYKLNTEEYPDLTGTLGEAPCSELESTGEYDAWVANGDVVSAFFAHDHVNSFAATTKDGIYMGYNGGTGFNTYNFGDNRTCRVIRIDANDTSKVDTNLIYYKDVVGEKFNFYITDILNPVIISILMKLVYALPSLIATIFGL